MDTFESLGAISDRIVSRMADWLAHAEGSRRRAHQYRLMADTYPTKAEQCRQAAAKQWENARFALRMARVARQTLAERKQDHAA